MTHCGKSYDEANMTGPIELILLVESYKERVQRDNERLYKQAWLNNQVTWTKEKNGKYVPIYPTYDDFYVPIHFGDSSGGSTESEKSDVYDKIRERKRKYEEFKRLKKQGVM